MSAAKEIQGEIDRAKAAMPYGEPCIRLPAEDVLVDKERRSIVIAMKNIKAAFEYTAAKREAQDPSA